MLILYHTPSDCVFIANCTFWYALAGLVGQIVRIQLATLVQIPMERPKFIGLCKNLKGISNAINQNQTKFSSDCVCSDSTRIRFSRKSSHSCGIHS